MSKHKKSSKKPASQARSKTSVPSALSPHVLIGIAIIVAAAFFAYFPSLSGGFIWDDNLLLAESTLVKSSDGLYRFWCTTEAQDYWPATYSTFWIEWRLWGMNPSGYHVTNLILHIIEALLIWIIVRRLSIPGAFLAAIIFAVHPVNVESVSWIAQRKNLMAMLFFLLSILWYIKHLSSIRLDDSQRSRDSPNAEPAHGVCGVLPGRWYWLSLGAFVLAMLSKGSVAVLPVLLLVIIWWLRSTPQGTVPIFAQQKWDCPLRFLVLHTVPFFAVAIALTGVNIWFQKHGTDLVIRTAGFVERLLGAGGILWFYLYKALLPFDLSFVYRQWHIDVGNPLWWLPLLAALITSAVLWRYRKTWSRPFLFAWGFFCVALVPVLGFTDVYFMKFSLVADHYQHIALIGVIILAAAGLNLWQQSGRNEMHRAAMAVAVVAVSTLAFLTWRQSGLYRDEITLYQATLEKNPDCWMAHINLGKAFSDKGRPDEEIKHYEQALRLKPDYSEAHNNLGSALVQAGRLQEGIEHLEQALRLKPDDPEVHNNLGAALTKAGRTQDAIKYYEQALQLRPGFSEAHFNLGNVLSDTGRPQEAITHYEQALQLKPDYIAAHNNLAIILIKVGRPREAIEHFKRVLQLSPENIEAWNNLAMTYASMHQFPEAIAIVQKALELARTQGQTVKAREIENWLKSNRDKASNLPNTPLPSKSASPPP